MECSNMREQIKKEIERERIIAIVRGADSEQCADVAQALYDGGIRFMEITFSLKDPQSYGETARAISTVCRRFDGRMRIGAGTVVSPELVKTAADAGAGYIISPDVNGDVIQKTLDCGLVSLPGAATPSEIMKAHGCGADFVKLFPAGELGAGYVKAVLAPISHVKLMAVGGVNENNAAEFIRAGAAGVGVGGNLANKYWIAAGAWEKITDAAKQLVTAVNTRRE